MPQKPRILSMRELPSSEAKWVTLKELKWMDEDGTERTWECAERLTRGKSGVDAVVIFAILKSEKDSFPPSTVIVEQYRPPLDKYIIEFPAGLVDQDETPVQAAIRELQEETGFKADTVIDSSPLMGSDPGLATTNMMMITLGVTFPDQLKLSKPKLESGEHIVKRIVEIRNLYKELIEYDKKGGFMVDSRLMHFAMGQHLLAQYH